MSDIENKRSSRRQYLVTYSQADLEKFPSRKHFGETVKAAFESGSGKVVVSHWACAREEHQDGNFHYHCSVKLSDKKKWFPVKKYFQSNHSVVLNFSDKHDHYVSAYRYLTKEDDEVEHSDNHPDLTNIGSPRTKACIKACRAKKRKSSDTETSRTHPVTTESDKPSSSKRSRLSALEVSDFIHKNEIHEKTTLYAKAESRKSEGDCELAMFLFSRNEKYISELIDKTWLMKNANSEIERKKRSRLDLIHEFAQSPCKENCTWLTSALQVLALNSITVNTFAGYLYHLIKTGRGKWKNLMIVGRSNCAKTFMLKPLTLIFRCFENPSNDKFAWVGAENAEVILLQDFRYSKEVISWKDLLLLLEGETVKLPAPKNHYTSDVIINSDVPIFATSKSPIVYRGPYNVEDERETDMMNSRWKIVEFKHVFGESDQKNIEPCASCFSRLVLMGSTS